MVLDGEDFEVRDAKTGDDLTRSILLQIILEEETGGVPMFSTPMLSQIIRFYGHAMQGVMGSLPREEHADLHRHAGAPRRAVARACTTRSADARAVDAVPERAGAGGAGPDGQLPRAVAASMFVQMQEQMAKQAETLFPGMPGLPAAEALSGGPGTSVRGARSAKIAG